MYPISASDLEPYTALLYLLDKAPHVVTTPQSPRAGVLLPVHFARLFAELAIGLEQHL
jgi:hypothetical protein